MNAATAKTTPPRVQRGTRQAQQLHLPQVSQEARKRAATVLEVLGGLRTPLQAAQELKVALPSYYHLELRALHGLIHGCEAPVRGRQKTAERELAEAQEQCRKLTTELHRYQSLARATQRTLGLLPPAPRPEPAAGHRRRKPLVRALQAADLLLRQKPAPEGTISTTPATGSGG